MNPLKPVWWAENAYLILLRLQRPDGNYLAAAQSSPERHVRLEKEFAPFLPTLPEDYSLGSVWLDLRGWSYGGFASSGVVVHRGSRTITPFHDQSAILEGDELIALTKIGLRIKVSRVPYAPDAPTDVGPPERQYVPK